VLKSGNVNLTTPFTFVAYGDSFTITGDLGIDIRAYPKSPAALNVIHAHAK